VLHGRFFAFFAVLSAGITLVLFWTAGFEPALAQNRASDPIDTRCRPAIERTSDFGCYILAHVRLPTLEDVPVYWHLDTYPSRALAEAARGPSSAVVESHGEVWLLTVEKKDWRPREGHRVAEVGPLPVVPGVEYAAQFMEAVFPPGPTVQPHEHPGPEAWYMLGGEQCAETPAGVFRAKAGEGLVLPGDTPMVLHIVGSTIRRSLVLIVHDAARPATTYTERWSPSGLCEQR
jgi:quercetin dioxygenase-like cupin family protein